jgi:flagellar biosynthesis protein FlhF
MLVKTFQAEEMSEALRMVKAEMGLDAMILSSKKERRKGLLGYFSKPYFEVTAAIEPRPATVRPDPYHEPAPPPPAPEPERSTREEFQNSMLGPLARELRELKLRVEELTKKDAQQQAARAHSQELPAEPEQPRRTFAKEEVEEIKKLLYSAVSKEKQVARRVTFPPVDAPQEAVQVKDGASAGQAPEEPVPGVQAAEGGQAAAEQVSGVQAAEGGQAPAEPVPGVQAPPVFPSSPAPLDLLGQELRAGELGAAQVELLLEEVRSKAADGAGIGELRRLAAASLAQRVKCSGAPRMQKNRCRVMAFVGPTGVGKTTTIAKLAALYGVNRGASLALITIDKFRVGAVEQLAAYAKIFDIPLEVVSDPAELAAALAKHADKSLVLIDTAGSNHKDAGRIEELRGYLECHPGIGTYLCLSATTRGRELDDMVTNFRKLPLDRLLFTKLDESESFGCIIDIHLRHQLPVSYLTTGQRVPEDIEAATANRLASLVMKGAAGVVRNNPSGGAEASAASIRMPGNG